MGGAAQRLELSAPRSVVATRYVAPLREGGSLPALVEADDDGLYVLKFRGAGQGSRVLAAELIAARLAVVLGLPVPEVVLAEVDPAMGAAEPDPEIQDLLKASAGLNLAMDFLPGALAYLGEPVDADLAAATVWFDALLTNVDRTFRNPNLLWWHGRLQLIDHGAALHRQFAWEDPAAEGRRPFPAIAQHVLLAHAGSITDAHERLAPAAAAALDEVVAAVPGEWIVDPPDAYVEHLATRLASGFAGEAEEAGRGA